MECSDYQKIITTLLADGALDGVEKEKAIAHMESCDVCRQAFGHTRDLIMELRSFETPQPSDAFLKKLQDSAYNKVVEKKPLYRNRTLRNYLAMAASLILVIVGTFMLSNRNDITAPTNITKSTVKTEISATHKTTKTESAVSRNTGNGNTDERTSSQDYDYVEKQIGTGASQNDGGLTETINTLTEEEAKSLLKAMDKEST